MAANIIHHKFSDYLVQRWKNGGGKTTEIAKRLDAEAGADFIWRLSIAEIKQNGPFSVFPRIDRTLMLISGEGIELTFGDDGITHRIDDLYSCLTFDGGLPAICKLIDGETTDFNIMTRQGVVTHDVDLLKNINGRQCIITHQETMLVFCLKGEVVLEAGAKRFSLTEYDMVEINSEEAEQIFLCPNVSAVCAIIHIKNI